MSGTTLILIVILAIIIYGITKLLSYKIEQQQQEIKTLKNVNNKELKTKENFKNEYDKENTTKQKMTNKEKREKGNKYEIFLEQYFINLDYQVDPRGQRLGVNDNGIDLILKKNDIYTLIQCKNFAHTTKLSQKIVRMFNGDCMQFIKNNPTKFNELNTNFLFIIPYEQSLNKVTKEYFKDNTNKCNYKIIELKE